MKIGVGICLSWWKFK